MKHRPVSGAVLIAGSFTMGEEGHSRETPLHTITIGYSFAAGKYDVTFDEWDACVADGGCMGCGRKTTAGGAAAGQSSMSRGTMPRAM